MAFGVILGIGLRAAALRAGGILAQALAKLAKKPHATLMIPLGYAATEIVETYVETKKIDAETEKQRVETLANTAQQLNEQGRPDEAAALLMDYFNQRAQEIGQPSFIDTLKGYLDMNEFKDFVVVGTAGIVGITVLDKVLD